MNQVTSNNEKEMALNERLLKALAASPQTDEAILEVINENGLITLVGEVDSPETRLAVAHIVANEPGVISVINNLTVSENR